MTVESVSHYRILGKLGAPRPLFRTGTVSYDVAPGGQKFLLDVVGDQGSRPITLVPNWSAVLKK